MISPKHPRPSGAPARPRIRKAHSASQEYGREYAQDSSTYYEYIAQHTGPRPVVSPPPPGPPQPSEHSAHPLAPAPVRPGRRGGPGRPGGPRRWRAALVGGAAVALIVAVAIVLGVVLLGPDRGTRAEDIASSTDSPAPTGPSQSADVDTTAGEQLSAHVEEGTRIAQERLAEKWVVQLSAKKPGLEANGKTWAEEEILAEFEANRARSPEAILLWSSDWSSFRLGEFWVTVLAEPYDTPEEALLTCRNLGLDRDNCFAKKLSTTEGPDDTTRLND